jgi:hypothetical protein
MQASLKCLSASAHGNISTPGGSGPGSKDSTGTSVLIRQSMCFGVAFDIPRLLHKDAVMFSLALELA